MILDYFIYEYVNYLLLFIFQNIDSAHSLLDLQHLLGEELLYAELIQRSGCQDIVLATFETSLLELLYPSPYLRKGLVAGADVNLLMEPTRCFPVSFLI